MAPTTRKNLSLVLATTGNPRGARQWLVGAALSALLIASSAFAHEDDDHSVLMSKEEALETVAFPDSDRIERRTLFLEPDELTALSQRAYSKVEARLQTVYVGWQGDKVTGYAMIIPTLCAPRPPPISWC